MTVENILAKLLSFPVLGGESNLSIIHWIKEYIESYGITTTLVPNEEENNSSWHRLCRAPSCTHVGKGGASCRRSRY